MSSRARSLRRQMSSARAALNRPWLHVENDAHPVVDDDPALRTAHALLILQTYAVEAPRPELGIHHYQIELAPDADAPRLVLLIRRERADLYSRCLEVEGTERRVDAAFHPSKRLDGSFCRVLDSLEVIPQ